MKYDTSELCDIYQEDVNVVEPLFSNFGGRSSFGGQIITVKCFEDNGLLDDLEDLDIGIQAIAAIPVGAAGDGIGESDVRVNFGGVTFFSGDHLYADNTGIILSEDALDIE